MAPTSGGIHRPRPRGRYSYAFFGKFIGLTGETVWQAGDQEGTAQAPRFDGARYTALEPVAESRGRKGHLPETHNLGAQLTV
jgi:hypothetical protein